jgi:hypothetical protein
MDDIFKYGLGAIAPIMDKLTSRGLSQEQVDEQIKGALEKQKTDQEKSMMQQQGMGQPKTMKKGGKVFRSSASKRADGCAVKGFTRA